MTKAQILDYKSGASPIILAAIAQIEASGAAAAERAKRRDADKTYQFLSRVAAENEPVLLTGEHLFAFYATAEFCRRQRAEKLRFIRQAVILMGRCNTRSKLLEACKRLRVAEKARAHIEAMDGEIMPRLDATLNTIRTLEIA